MVHIVKNSNVGHYILLLIVALGIWLPFIQAGYWASRPDAPLAAVVYVSFFMFLCLHAASLIVLTIYALWLKPWRRVKFVRVIFYIHASAISIFMVFYLIFFLS